MSYKAQEGLKMKYIVFSDLHAHLFNDFAKPDEEYINTKIGRAHV